VRDPFFALRPPVGRVFPVLRNRHRIANCGVCCANDRGSGGWPCVKTSLKKEERCNGEARW